jgi:general secretion pathway protein H
MSSASFGNAPVVRQPRPAAGFTLIEMIVVLAILGLLAGLIVSRGPMHSQRLDLEAAAQQVAGSLRLARANAIAQDRTILWRADAGGFGLPGGRLYRLPAGISMRGPATIGFAGDGSSSGGNLLLAGGTRNVTVAVNWLTGGISLSNNN